jgi:hypothetical protein
MADEMINQNKDESRLYFIIRSWLMGLFGAVIFYISILFLGSINFIKSVIIGTIAFVFSLALSRLFDKNIEKISRKILRFLGRHTPIRNFILRYF